MTRATCGTDGPLAAGDDLPEEWLELLERIQAQPPEVRAELEPVVGEALEQARFRGRVLTVARDALEQLRLDLELTRFDLDATRREREDLRRRLAEPDCDCDCEGQGEADPA